MVHVLMEKCLGGPVTDSGYLWDTDGDYECYDLMIPTGVDKTHPSLSNSSLFNLST